MLQLNKDIKMGRKPFVAQPVEVDEATLQRRAEREAREAQKRELEEQANIAKNYLSNMGNTEIIMFENE
jgi:hypothetical protein